MGLLCEASRIFSLGARHLWSHIEPFLAQRMGYHVVPEAEAKTKPWVDYRDVSRVGAMRDETNVGFKLQMIIYHSFCASLVGVAVAKDWLSVEGGGMAWELWAVWQQVCLWTLFLENLVRCVCFPAEALKSSTFKVVCLYTVPLLSEVTDTMKDWVMTGLCVLATQSPAGLVTGGIMISWRWVACIWRSRLEHGDQDHGVYRKYMPTCGISASPGLYSHHLYLVFAGSAGDDHYGGSIPLLGRGFLAGLGRRSAFPRRWPCLQRHYLPLLSSAAVLHGAMYIGWTIGLHRVFNGGLSCSSSRLCSRQGSRFGAQALQKGTCSFESSTCYREEF